MRSFPEHGDDTDGEVVLGGFGEKLGAVGENEEGFVFVGVEADIVAGDVVGDDEVAALCRELEACVLLDVFRLCGEAY